MGRSDKRAIKERLKSVQLRIDNLLLTQGQASSADAMKLVVKTFEAFSKAKGSMKKRLLRRLLK